MEQIYKLARAVTGIFIAITFIAATWPYLMILIHGPNSQTISMLVEHLPYLIALVFLALSFRFMDKRESQKKRHIGLVMFMVLMTAILIGSFYLEKIIIEEEMRQKQEFEYFKALKEKQDVNKAVEQLLNQMESNKMLDISNSTK